jgi:hypothetical protein
MKKPSLQRRDFGLAVALIMLVVLALIDGLALWFWLWCCALQ